MVYKTNLLQSQLSYKACSQTLSIVHWRYLYQDIKYDVDNGDDVDEYAILILYYVICKLISLRCFKEIVISEAFYKSSEWLEIR